jgi:hypothetical protein
MFLGHFGLAFAAKKMDHKPSLATTFLAAQFIDLLWPVFLIAGLEHVKVEPGNTAFTPLNFESYPYSHSLVATLIWAILFAFLYYLVRKNRKTALLLGLLVISHWLLDFITHRPDLPISFYSDSKYGLGLWNNRLATISVELLIFATGGWLYTKSTRARSRWGNISLVSLFVFFLLIYFMNAFGDPPPNEHVIGYVGLAQWLFILWAYWCDRTRTNATSQ